METSSSPDATARRLAVVDQETDHTGWLDWALGSTVLTQELPGSPVLVQIMTVPSSEQLAMVSRGTPMLGAHATSRTQSVCPARVTHSQAPSPLDGLLVQMRTRWSQPAEASCLTSSTEGPDLTGMAGPQLTALTPTLWASAGEVPLEELPSGICV